MTGKRGIVVLLFLIFYIAGCSGSETPIPLPKTEQKSGSKEPANEISSRALPAEAALIELRGEAEINEGPPLKITWQCPPDPRLLAYMERRQFVQKGLLSPRSEVNVREWNVLYPCRIEFVAQNGHTYTRWRRDLESRRREDGIILLTIRPECSEFEVSHRHLNVFYDVDLTPYSTALHGLPIFIQVIIDNRFTLKWQGKK